MEVARKDGLLTYDKEGKRYVLKIPAIDLAEIGVFPEERSLRVTLVYENDPPSIRILFEEEDGDG